MKFLLLLAILLLAGCFEQPRVAVKEEPDTEWIVAQYQLYGDYITNERRKREGW